MKSRRTEPLDTTIAISTPENVEFSYTLAGPFRRFSAFLIDMGVIFGCILSVILVLTLVSYFLYRVGIPDITGLFGGLLLVFLFCCLWFYGGFFEILWNGQTPGKRLLRLRVLTVQGQPINMFQALLRNVIRTADLFPFTSMVIPVGLGTVGLCVCSMNRRFQRLGDLASGTMVVLESSLSSRGDLVRFTHPDVLKMAEIIPKTLRITPDLEKVLSLYVHRRKSLPQMRREEIASCLAVPLQELTGIARTTNPDLFLCGLYHQISNP